MLVASPCPSVQLISSGASNEVRFLTVAAGCPKTNMRLDRIRHMRASRVFVGFFFWQGVLLFINEITDCDQVCLRTRVGQLGV